jgi:hypothetical protein
VRIRSVQVIDDDPGVRETYADKVQDAELIAVPENDQMLGSLDEFLARQPRADAGLSDFDLKPSGYAGFNGAELVSGWYTRNFPGILCTRYEKIHIERIRPLRRHIPVLITPDKLNPESILLGLEECVRELSGKVRPTRRAWRTQVHFLENEMSANGTFTVELPAWGLEEAIRVRGADLPDSIRAVAEPGFRCHAFANLGAEESEDLFLDEWVVTS